MYYLVVKDVLNYGKNVLVEKLFMEILVEVCEFFELVK